MIHCETYPVYTRFHFYTENDLIYADLEAYMCGECYHEQETWESPGCDEYTIDVDSVEIEGHISTSEHDFEDYTDITLYGEEALEFLDANGWSEDTIEWREDDDY